MQTTTNHEATNPSDASASGLGTNKQTVLAFYELALNNKDFDRACRLIGPRYVQQNPLIADDVDGLKGFIDYLRVTFPQLRAEVKQIFAEGAFVVAHVHGVRVPGQRGSAIVDIFRLENGKIVEHWDSSSRSRSRPKTRTGCSRRP